MRFKQHKTLSVSLCYHAGCLETRHGRNRRSGLWFWHCSCISNISTPKAVCINLLLEIRYSQSPSYWGAFCVYNYTLFPYAYIKYPHIKTIAKNWNTNLSIWDNTGDYGSWSFFVNVAVSMKECSLWNHSGLTKSHCCDSQTVANGFIGNTAVTLRGTLPAFSIAEFSVLVYV